MTGNAEEGGSFVCDFGGFGGLAFFGGGGRLESRVCFFEKEVALEDGCYDCAGGNEVGEEIWKFAEEAVRREDLGIIASRLGQEASQS
jgi:hypothetical protein